MDDIIITAPTDEEHLERLGLVFSRLDQDDIRLNPQKCAFFEGTVTYCGFGLEHQEIHKCDDKLVAIWRPPAPRNIGEPSSFLEIIQFYPSTASKLADLASTLHELLEFFVELVWFDRIEEAFVSAQKVIIANDPCPSRSRETAHTHYRCVAVRDFCGLVS